MFIWYDKFTLYTSIILRRIRVFYVICSTIFTLIYIYVCNALIYISCNNGASLYNNNILLDNILPYSVKQECTTLFYKTII